MKVLKNNCKGKRKICNNCKSILDVQLNDIKKEFEQRYFKCPLCNNYNYVDISEWFD